MSSILPGSKISAILRQNSKVMSYKIALLHAISDVVLVDPDVASSDEAVAVPLCLLADCWIAYYWPFADPQTPILQGPVSGLLMDASNPGCWMVHCHIAEHFEGGMMLSFDVRV